jgi:hypothetical protein
MKKKTLKDKANKSEEVGTNRCAERSNKLRAEQLPLVFLCSWNPWLREEDEDQDTPSLKKKRRELKDEDITSLVIPAIGEIAIVQSSMF